jgi:hypothetical protein
VPPRSLCLRHARSGALANLLRLNLRQRGQHRKQDIADQLVVRRQMRLGVAVKANAGSRS